MDYIISYLNENIAKKIFGNKNIAIRFLNELNKKIEITDIEMINNRTEATKIWKTIVKYWDYQVAKSIIRELFKQTPKYINGKDSDIAINALIKEWHSLNLGNIEWPCSQGDFDGFVQRVNNSKDSGLLKDEKVKLAAVKYRRLKEINTVRNDYIETLIFEKNENIVPTLKHSRGVDFYINGISFDQKVAKSPTKEFIRDYGDGWKDYAISNPNKVAEYLYKYQDEGRFGADPRLLIVYLDENIPVIKLKEKIDKTDFSKPIEINFTYKHKNLGEKLYKTNCFIILLSN